jgi:hypothetical protein
MTEAELRAVPQFAALPVYDEADERTEPIARAHAGECATLEEVEACLADPGLVPLGAVRAYPGGSPVVVAYFGARPP